MINQWIKDLESGNADIRSRALQHLQQLGPAARSAVPALIAALEKSKDLYSLTPAIANTLGAIGPDARTAVPLLVPLASTNIAIPLAILQIGGELGQERLAVRSLLRMYEGRGSYGHDSYPIDLWRWEKELMRPRAERIIACLAELLTDSNENVRSRAAETLAGYGAQAANIVPALVAALNDPSASVSSQVVRTLAKVEPDRSKAIAALVAHLPNPEVAAYVCDALRQLGGSEALAALEVALNAIVAALNDPAFDVRIKGALALTTVEPGRTKEAIAALLPLVSNSEATSSVCEALRHLGEDTVPHLLPLLRQHTGEAQIPYIEALRVVGEPILPALRQELRGASVAGRMGAARTLGLLAINFQAAFEDLALVLQDADAEVRSAAAQGLVESNAVSAGFPLPNLIAGLESTQATYGRNVIKLLLIVRRTMRWRTAATLFPALVKLDPAVTATLADRVEFLRDQRAEGVWDSLFNALGELGSALRPLIPALQDLLPNIRAERADQLKALLAGIK